MFYFKFDPKTKELFFFFFSDPGQFPSFARVFGSDHIKIQVAQVDSRVRTQKATRKVTWGFHF